MALRLPFIIIILSQLYLINNSEIVSISFNSFFKQGTKTNITSIDDLAHTNLFSKINIGTPSYEIKTFLSVQHSFFSITPNRISKNVNDFLSHYDLKKSNSFKNITVNGRYLLDTNYDSIAKETFQLNMFNYIKKEYHNISIDDMIFIYNDNKNKDNNLANSYYLNIGLQIINQKKYKERENFNFIHQLKKRNIIQNYDWSIFFEKGKIANGSFLYNPDQLINAKGQLLIGDLPSKYNQNFHKSQMLTAYSIYSDKLFKWALEFSNIYYNKSMNETIKISIAEVHLNINNYIILSPMTYYYNIKKDFFDYYINTNQCKNYIGSEYRTFYCDKTENFTIENLKKFPTLYMEHIEFQYIFELTYEDLFIEKNGKYWFLIALSSFNSDLEEWFMGIIFLRKYSLIFNQDSKTISFYNPNLPIINNNNNKSENLFNKNIIAKYYIIIIIIIFVTIICVILYFIIRLYLGKKFFKLNKERKRLNHIDDNFDYIEQKNFDINKKGNYGKNLLMEMKGLIYS